MLFVLGINNGFTLANFISRCKITTNIWNIQGFYGKNRMCLNFLTEKTWCLHECANVTFTIALLTGRPTLLYPYFYATKTANDSNSTRRKDENGTKTGRKRLRG